MAGSGKLSRPVLVDECLRSLQKEPVSCSRSKKTAGEVKTAGAIQASRCTTQPGRLPIGKQSTYACAITIRRSRWFAQLTPAVVLIPDRGVPLEKERQAWVEMIFPLHADGTVPARLIACEPAGQGGLENVVFRILQDVQIHRGHCQLGGRLYVANVHPVERQCQVQARFVHDVHKLLSPSS